MKLFSLIQLGYNKFEETVRTYINKLLDDYNTRNSSIFGQLINVLGSVVQNVFSYIEDALTEQNKYTAQRKRSIYNLASISGYEPNLGSACSMILNISFKSNNQQKLDIIIPNHTTLSCSQNNCNYSIILDNESVIMSLEKDNSSKSLKVVEGTFETQSFISYGGELYTQNVSFSGDVDKNYIKVYVNNVEWNRADSFYDMNPESNQYLIKTSLKKGIDLVFGNGQFGKSLVDGDVIKIEYLLHSGSEGNITAKDNCEFSFKDTLTDISGEEIDGNEVFNLIVYDAAGVSTGTDSDDIETIRNMIGMNSRSLVLAASKNYKQFLNRFSFVGYNKTWADAGSLVVNSLILKNYQANLDNGSDYFNLKENDFILSDTQKQSIYDSIEQSNQSIAGSVFNIFDPELVKYSMYLYVKLKDTHYDTSIIETQIRNLIGNFFANISNDIYIPKSDISHLLKSNIDEIDGVNVYFISKLNEDALINKYYTNKIYTYNFDKSVYNIKEEFVYLYDGENPNLGLDSHGNIQLDSVDQVPVLMGGWSFLNDNNSTVTVTDPLNIIFE